MSKRRLRPTLGIPPSHIQMHGEVRELPMHASGGDGLLVTPIDMAHPAVARIRHNTIPRIQGSIL